MCWITKASYEIGWDLSWAVDGCRSSTRDCLRYQHLGNGFRGSWWLRSHEWEWCVWLDWRRCDRHTCNPRRIRVPQVHNAPWCNPTARWWYWSSAVPWACQVQGVARFVVYLGRWRCELHCTAKSGWHTLRHDRYNRIDQRVVQIPHSIDRIESHQGLRLPISEVELWVNERERERERQREFVQFRYENLEATCSMNLGGYVVRMCERGTQWRYRKGV